MTTTDVSNKFVDAVTRMQSDLEEGAKQTVAAINKFSGSDLGRTVLKNQTDSDDTHRNIGVSINKAMAESGQSTDLNSLLEWIEGFSQLKKMLDGELGRPAKAAFGRFSHACSKEFVKACNLTRGVEEVLKHVEDKYIPEPFKKRVFES